MSQPPRVAIVTGASRGLGAHICRRLAADGWIVVVNFHASSGAADAVVASIQESGGQAYAVQADVTDEVGIQNLVAAAGELGAIGALVANATGPQPEAALDDITWQHHLDQLEFFVKSPTLLVQAALPALRGGGGGRVVLIGSDMYLRALPGGPPTSPPSQRSSD